MNTQCLIRFSSAPLLFAALFTLSGCSTVGEKEFACPGRPPGVRCMSATEVYEATQNNDFVEPTAQKAIGSDAKAANKKRKKSARSKAPEVIEPDANQHDPRFITAAALLPAIEKPIPIRTPAEVMRVWVAPWEDAKGILHAGGYHFIEIEQRRWVLGEPSITNEPVRLFSIQNSTGAKPAGDAKGTVGKDSAAKKRAEEEKKAKPTPSSSLPKTGASS